MFVKIYAVDLSGSNVAKCGLNLGSQMVWVRFRV